MSLRGARFAAMREVASGVKIQSHKYKTIADPTGKLTGRNLWSVNESFTPQFLLFIASNHPPTLDDSSLGSSRRTSYVNFGLLFVHDPTLANERPINTRLESQFPAWRNSLFYLLLDAYKVFLQGRDQIVVLPVPFESRDAALQDTDEEWMKQLKEFTTECLEAANATEASTAAEVRQAFDAYSYGSVPKREIGLRMARKGFKEDKVNYWDGINDVKRGATKCSLSLACS